MMTTTLANEKEMEYAYTELNGIVVIMNGWMNR